MLNNINDLLLVAGKQEEYEPYYEVLEKITLTGAEYFDLGYKLSDFAIGDTIRFEGIIKGTDASTISSSGSQLIFSLGNDGGQWLGKAQNGTKYAFGSSNQSTIDFNEEVLADVTITLSGNASKPTFTIAGSVTSDTTTSTIAQRSATPTYYDFPLLFGAGTKATGEKAYGGDYTIKCGKIYINGTMTKDYIPVLDNQMKPCLYDKISKTFTYAKKISDGTTTYDLGFKRWNKFDVDYISFTGTQYIDSGLQASYTSLDQAPVCEFEGKIDTLPTNASTMQRFISAGGSGTGEKYYQIFVNWNTSGTPKIPIGFQCGPASPYMEAREADTNWHYYKYDIPNKEALIDNTSYDMTSYTSTSVSIPYNLYIGARNLNGVADRFLIGSLKWLKWSIGDKLVRDFKPVVWHNGDSTAEACLYDEVYNKMYPNLGTGSLKAYITNDTNYTLMSYTYMNTHGYYISATGVVTAQGESDYTDAIAVQQGDIVTLTTSTTSRVSNKRIHGYNGTSTNDWVSQLGVIEYAQAGGDTRTLSVVVPSGVSYIRISHSIYGETQCDLTITRTYEVGSSIQNTETAYIATGVHPTENTGVRTVYNYIENSSNSAGVVGTYNSSTETTLYVSTYSGTTVTSTTIGLYHRAGSLDTVTIMPKPLIGVKHIASINYMNDGQFNFDDDETLNKNVGTGTVINQEIRLFGRYRGGSYSNTKCAIGYTEFTEDKDFLAKLVPARNATVTTDVGYFDKVSKEFITTPTSTLTWNALD